MFGDHRADLVRDSPRAVGYAIETLNQSVARGFVHQHVGSTSRGEVAFEATKVLRGTAESVDEHEEMRRTVSGSCGAGWTTRGGLVSPSDQR